MWDPIPLPRKGITFSFLSSCYSLAVKVLLLRGKEMTVEYTIRKLKLEHEIFDVAVVMGQNLLFRS